MLSSAGARVILMAAAAGLVGCFAGDRARQPQAASPATESPPTVERLLALDEHVQVYVPERVARDSSAVDVLVHFHGYAPIVQREVDRAAINAAVVIVNYKGLSRTYETPYSEPERFATVLRDALLLAKSRGLVAPDAEWRRVYLSSFSAGYGAVRTLLTQEVYYTLISGVYLADSLYAGWADGVAYRGADAKNMQPFRKLAVDAAAGKKVFLVSHSYYDPREYAGTHVTADDLLSHVGLERRDVSEPGPQDMTIVSRAERGGLAVWGCTAPAEEHGRHLQNMHFWLTRLVR